jgi:hypothetical protein
MPKHSVGGDDSRRKRKAPFQVRPSPWARALKTVRNDATACHLLMRIKFWWTERKQVGLWRDDGRWIAFTTDQWVTDSGLTLKQHKRSMRVLIDLKLIEVRHDKVSQRQQFFTAFVRMPDAVVRLIDVGTDAGPIGTTSEIDSGPIGTAYPSHSGPIGTESAVHSGPIGTSTIGSEDNIGIDDDNGYAIADAIAAKAPPEHREEAEGAGEIVSLGYDLFEEGSGPDFFPTGVAAGSRALALLDDSRDCGLSPERVEWVARTLQPQPSYSRKGEFQREWIAERFADPKEALAALRATAVLPPDLAWMLAHVVRGERPVRWGPKEFGQAETLMDRLGRDTSAALMVCAVLWDDFVAMVNGKQKYTPGLGGYPELGALVKYAQAASGFLAATKRVLRERIESQQRTPSGKKPWWEESPKPEERKVTSGARMDF